LILCYEGKVGTPTFDLPYAHALLLALFSGFLFAMVPVRQVLRADPWQIIRSGSTGIA
jgi:hypothetical protein